MNDGVDSIETVTERANAQKATVWIVKAIETIAGRSLQNNYTQISMLSVSVLKPFKEIL